MGEEEWVWIGRQELDHTRVGSSVLRNVDFTCQESSGCKYRHSMHINGDSKISKNSKILKILKYKILVSARFS